MKPSQKVNWSIVLLIIVIGFAITIFIMLKYKNEGEKAMPINLNDILVVSSADAETKDEDRSLKWNLDIDQYNDVYLNFVKNQDYEKNDYLDSITIENIQVTKQPKIGKIEIYMPSSMEGKQFSYEDRYLVNNSLTYNGGISDDPKSLQISRTGGTFLFRILNRNVGEFVSDNDEEIAYDGTLLTKSGVTTEDLIGAINFDIVIKTNKTAYRGNLTVDFPSEKVKEQGVAQDNIDEYVDIVFKRERK
ncbi:MAG: hypothetical protein IKG14_05945 [Clostridia bacterium]|nr:hypothetical protein [Clostridia bacterium]